MKRAFISIPTKHSKSLHCWPTRLCGRAAKALTDSSAAQGMQVSVGTPAAVPASKRSITVGGTEGAIQGQRCCGELSACSLTPPTWLVVFPRVPQPLQTHWWLVWSGYPKRFRGWLPSTGFSFIALWSWAGNIPVTRLQLLSHTRKWLGKGEKERLSPFQYHGFSRVCMLQ